MKALILLTVLLMVSASTVEADSLQDSMTTISKTLCKRSMDEKNKLSEVKALKISSSKLDSICFLTAKQALSSCNLKNVELYKGFLTSKEKERVDQLVKTSLQYCAAYADLASMEIIDAALNDALSSKVSVDAALDKIISGAQK